jgi:hypothetical protein
MPSLIRSCAQYVAVILGQLQASLDDILDLMGLAKLAQILMESSLALPASPRANRSLPVIRSSMSIAAPNPVALGGGSTKRGVDTHDCIQPTLELIPCRCRARAETHGVGRLALAEEESVTGADLHT